jgi:hypothetical protein
VSMWHNEGRQRTLPTRLCACGDRATQGPRRRSHGHVSTASGAGGVRLHHRAAGWGILAGVATGGSRAAASDDAMLHGMRGNVMAHDGRCTMGWCKQSTCGRLDDDTRARSIGGIQGRQARQVGPVCQ